VDTENPSGLKMRVFRSVRGIIIVFTMTPFIALLALISFLVIMFQEIGHDAP